MTDNGREVAGSRPVGRSLTSYRLVQSEYLGVAPFPGRAHDRISSPYSGQNAPMDAPMK
jgi:hypothetical protein